MSEQLNPIEPPIPMVPPQTFTGDESPEQPPVAPVVNGADNAHNLAVVPVENWVSWTERLVKLEERAEYLGTQIGQLAAQVENLPTSDEMDAKTLALKVELLEKMQAHKDELHADMKLLRDEIHADMKSQGDELHASIKSQGDELRASIKSQGDELRAIIKSQGDEMNAKFQVQDANIKSLRDEVFARLDKLEAGYVRLEEAIKHLASKEQVAEIKENQQHLATKKEVAELLAAIERQSATTWKGALAIVVAVIGLAFTIAFT